MERGCFLLMTGRGLRALRKISFKKVTLFLFFKNSCVEPMKWGFARVLFFEKGVFRGGVIQKKICAFGEAVLEVSALRDLGLVDSQHSMIEI
jgi:hypothetical protein